MFQSKRVILCLTHHDVINGSKICFLAILSVIDNIVMYIVIIGY